MPEVPEPFDFFVSYARADNVTGWITRFIESLQDEQRQFTGGREFRVFFDKEDIRSLDDWRHRIQESLAASRLLVAFISPNYFASEWCRREWHTWIDVEISKHVLSDGAAPVYIVEVPWLASAMSEQQVAEEITRLTTGPGDATIAQDVIAVSGQVSQRQMTQALPFYSNGLDALRHEDLRRMLANLAMDLSDRSEHVRAAAGSRSTIPPYNRRFVGRLEELTLLRERLHQGRTGVISGHKGDLADERNIIASVHGLGGIGKTELAFTYAHAFAGLYPGGRFLVACDGHSDLRQAMLALDEIFRAEISDEQRKTLDLHFGAIRDCLRRRLHEMGRTLLVFDNVTDSALLSPEQTDSVRALGRELHLLATTRLGAPEGGGTFDDVHWIALGELSLEDSLRLLEKHNLFDTPEESAAAESIARRLGGFALCIEVVGAYLGQHPEQSYAQFLATMGIEDLAPVDLAAERRDVVTRRHNNEKRLRVILDHTLCDLPPEAMSVLHFASLLPPDHIVLPWLSKLVGDDHPALASDATAWQRWLARLASLALLTRGEDGEAHALDESNQPRILRCHRLLQAYLHGKSDAGEETARQEAVDALVHERDAALVQTIRWEDVRWEMEPLDALAVLWADAGHSRASWLLCRVGEYWRELAEWSRAELLIRRALALDEPMEGEGQQRASIPLNNLATLLLTTNRPAEAEPLLRRSLALDEATFGPDHPEVAVRLSNLASLLQNANRLAEAEPLKRRALAIDEVNSGLDSPIVAIRLNNLAHLLQATNRIAEAEPLMRRALAIDEANFGTVHSTVARDLRNLGLLLAETNRLAEAEPLLIRALAIDEDCFGHDHPSIATDLGNLGKIFLSLNRLEEAEPVMRRALAIDEARLGQEHPEVATHLNNLGQLLHDSHRFAEAEPFMHQALAIWEKSFGPNHPNVASGLSNLARLCLATNRKADAEPLLQRGLQILLNFTVETGHRHPLQQLFLANYTALLRATGLGENEVQQRLNELFESYSISLE